MPTLKVPQQQIEAEIGLADSGSGQGGRRKTVTFYSGATVIRGVYEPYNLTLSMNPRHVRMGRLKSGKAPVLDTHSDFSLKDVIGVIEGARIKEGRGYADLRFSERPEVDPIWNDIESGIIRNASVGARIFQLKDVTEPDAKTKSYLAVDWEPLEVSIVPIGADMEAGFRAAAEKAEFTDARIVLAEEEQGAEQARNLEATMPENLNNAGSDTRTTETSTPAPAATPEADRQKFVNAGIDAERARVGIINETVKALKLRQSFADKHIAAGTEIHIFRELAIAEAKAEEERKLQESRLATPAGDQRLRDEADARRVGMMGALLERFEPLSWRFNVAEGAFEFDKKKSQKLYDGSRAYVGMSLLDIARECLSVVGIRWQAKNRAEIVNLAFQSTSDFPNILSSVANKSLRAGYEMADSQWRLIAARRTAPDFKLVSEMTIDGNARLEKVTEQGEFKYGKLVEGKETWQLATYGKIIGVTRQCVINDDLGAFTRTPFLLGQEVAMLEADTVIGIIIANGNLADGQPLFVDAAHKNHIDAGGDIAIDTLGAARVKMALQSSPGGKTMGLVPRYLLAPATQGVLAEQYCSQNYQAVEAAKINPMAGRLVPIVEARLDAADVDAWYLFADPQSPNGTVLIYAYLEGQEGPYTENRQGFNIDGVEIKIRHDFAAAAIDYRGAVKNDGK